MKRTTAFAFLFLIATTALAQAPPCTQFDRTTLEDWTPVNSTATFASDGARRWVEVRDGPGASNFVAPARYRGNWLGHSDGCGSICFDVSIIEDGLPTSTPVQPYFVIEDSAGHSASFFPNGIVERSGWKTVCAPARPLENGALPSNAGSSALSERLVFDNICFRPKACPEPQTDLAILDEVQAISVVRNWKTKTPRSRGA